MAIYSKLHSKSCDYLSSHYSYYWWQFLAPLKPIYRTGLIKVNEITIDPPLPVIEPAHFLSMRVFPVGHQTRNNNLNFWSYLYWVVGNLINMGLGWNAPIQVTLCPIETCYSLNRGIRHLERSSTSPVPKGDYHLHTQPWGINTLWGE